VLFLSPQCFLVTQGCLIFGQVGLLRLQNQEALFFGQGRGLLCQKALLLGFEGQQVLLLSPQCVLVTQGCFIFGQVGLLRLQRQDALLVGLARGLLCQKALPLSFEGQQVLFLSPQCFLVTQGCLIFGQVGLLRLQNQEALFFGQGRGLLCQKALLLSF